MILRFLLPIWKVMMMMMNDDGIHASKTFFFSSSFFFLLVFALQHGIPEMEYNVMNIVCYDDGHYDRS